jgi:predicted dehydrogenase
MAGPERLGCAVIGVGVMGASHARVWSELPNTRLASVFDLDPARAAAIAEEYGAVVAASVEEAVGRDDVAMVSVCTPDDSHLAPCLAAARARKHLLIEKPLAFTVADADAILAAVRASGVTAMVGHICRFDPRYAQARDRVRQGLLGDLIYAYARRHNVLSSPRRAAAHTDVIGFLAIHDIDAIHYVTGRRIVRVFARASRKLLADLGVDDAVVAVLDFDNGACGSLDALWVSPDGVMSALDARLDLVGSAGRIHIRDSRDLETIDAARTTCLDVTYGPVVGGLVAGALRTQLEHFAACVTTGADPLAPLDEAHNAVAVAEAIRRSLASGAPEAVAYGG